MVSVDVVVQILGFGGTNSPVQGEQQGTGKLANAVSSPIYAAKKDRKLVLIAYTGGQNPDRSHSIATAILTEVSQPDCRPGLICLVGESAGGKNVISIANDLSNPPIPIPLTYVGVADGAFDDNDAIEGPNWGGTNLMIRGKTFTARETVNYYQSAGNDTEISISKGRASGRARCPTRRCTDRSRISSRTSISAPMAAWSGRARTPTGKACTPTPCRWAASCISSASCSI